MSQLLDKINNPNDFRHWKKDTLIDLSHEIRQFIIENVSKTGGHFSSNLGVVELTVALHYVFQTPKDKIIWDVGHQAYAHKILTGRKDLFSTLRQYKGLSGFPMRHESIYDAFGTAHSSTSISASLGMAMANQEQWGIAVIGDGAMSAGMAFEALNHAGGLIKEFPHLKLLVILNDNEMSISPPVGALNHYLDDLVHHHFFNMAKDVAKDVANTFLPPPIRFLAKGAQEQAKILLGFQESNNFNSNNQQNQQNQNNSAKKSIFEQLGFTYHQPIDGHDVIAVSEKLESIKQLDCGIHLLHVMTKKGKGYAFAEEAPITYHGPSPFDAKVGIVKVVKNDTILETKTYTELFGDWIVQKAQKDERLMAVTPAMREGSGLVAFSKQFPRRYFDVGIAEQHAVTFAAGLACEGKKPVVAIYSTFLQRGYDQLIHDVALQNLDVMFAIDRAGLVGNDGATHAGNYDIAFSKCIPNMVLLSPSDLNETQLALDFAYDYVGVSSVRYPRGSGKLEKIQNNESQSNNFENNAYQLGKSRVIWNNINNIDANTNSVVSIISIVFLVFGTLTDFAKKCSELIENTNPQIAIQIIDMRFIKPLDIEVIYQLITKNHVDLIITLEEGCEIGGAGSSVLEYVNSLKFSKEFKNITNITIPPVKIIGIPDVFIEQGNKEILMKNEAGFDVQTIADEILEFFI